MDIEPTTRAYTVKLVGDGDWRRFLWSTHAAVNRGVWIWGEWLLTLRGGLPASLADGHPERRVLLALSWLSVESPETLVRAGVVTKATCVDRNEQIITTFRKVLADHGVDDIDGWVAACTSALTARLRDDAVWVNRHAAFQKLKRDCPGLNSDWAAQTLFDFLDGVDAYFAMPNDEEGKPTEAKDFVQKAGGWLSRNWGSGAKSDASSIGMALSTLADIESSMIVGKTGTDAIWSLLRRIAPDCKEEKPRDAFKALKQCVGWKGRPSKGAIALEKLLQTELIDDELWSQTKTKLLAEVAAQEGKASKGNGKPVWMDAWRSQMESPSGIDMPFRTTRDLIWEHGVMLDHALRRVSSAHSWIKRTEVKRQKFEDDATKEVVPEARQWLDAFCEQRADETGGFASDYIIRKGALDGWEKIVDAWGRLDKHATAADRIAATRDVQSNLGDDEKIGDMTLFERLAADNAMCVWRDAAGKTDPTILRNYSEATVAEFNRRRFKVPAYRHPDPLRNPIYVDFGNSRWGIVYSALKLAQNRSALRQKLSKAKTETTKAKFRAELDREPALRGVMLGLWTGETIEDVPFRWQGRRLWKDLDLRNFDVPSNATVVRADRLGRAVQNVPAGAVDIAEVFAAKIWNGRLQAPRKQLTHLADLIYGTERLEKDGQEIVVRLGADYAKLGQRLQDERSSIFFDRLNWFLTTSVKLKPSGPIWSFVADGLPEGVVYKKGLTGWYFDYEKNKGRKGRARLLLAEIPKLRILSLDLGVRYGAACAVWETLTQQALELEIEVRTVVAGGSGPKHLFLHTEHVGPNGMRRRTIYRRASSDMWARLERQFLIRLQGEDRSTRWARDDEQNRIAELRCFLGMKPISEKLRIDDLQEEAVKLARRGLRRLGNVARIAYAMTAVNKPLSGGKTSSEFTLEERIAYLQEALLLWQKYADDPEHEDLFAKELWQDVVVSQLGGPSSLTPVSNPAVSPSRSHKSKKQQRKDAATEPLHGIAVQLADHLSPLAVDLHRQWSARYRELERKWKAHLRGLRCLILPGKKEFDKGSARIRNVGGLSVKRLQNVRGLYEVMRSFRMRPEPDDLRKNIPVLGDESLANFGRRILDQLEELRQQRIKQLANRIVEGALGVGRVPMPCGRDRKRPQAIVDNPCHVVVAENLERYRPEETRLRRENRRLMDWAARNIRKYIVEGCQLNGLHFVEVSPKYTSQQDSRTGAPGIRCEDIPFDVLAAAADPSVNHPKSSRLQRQAARLSGEIEKAKAASYSDLNARQRVLLAACNQIAKGITKTEPIRLPRRGGDLFVSVDPGSPTAKGTQADLNAAANIGLKALMHPDYVGSWWFVLVNRTTGRPEPDKIKGCLLPELAHDAEPLLQFPNEGRSGKSKKDFVYAWNPLHDPVSEKDKEKWMETRIHQGNVEDRVARMLIQQQFIEQTPW